MSYHQRTSPSPMGNVIQQVGTAITQVAGIAGMASDPFAGELVCRIRQVVGLETGTSVPTCASVPLTTKSPAGLRKPIAGLRAYVYAEQHPWAYPAAVAAVVGIPFLLGYLIGKK